MATIEIPELTSENGPELAYGTLLHDLDGLRELDAHAPIIGSFRVEKIPEGRQVPLEIRQEWVGVDIPVRFPITLEAGAIEFTGEDAVLSLLAAGKIDAARWFAKDVNPILWPAWMFAKSEGNFTDAREAQEPLLSIEYYGALLASSARKALEGIDHSQPVSDETEV